MTWLYNLFAWCIYAVVYTIDRLLYFAIAVLVLCVVWGIVVGILALLRAIWRGLKA